jgi:selenium metabolism protein YedF
MENKVTELDARGLQCPAPVIQTKQALDSLEKGKLLTIVDNEVARDNIIKFARNQALEFGVEEKGEDFYITITKSKINSHVDQVPSGTVILVSSNTLGRGDDQLGSTLMKSYLYALNESEPLPEAILFINGGVKLPSEGSEVVEHLMNLEKQGVELLACGLCLDFFNLEEKLCVGQVTNMYTIIEKMNSATKVINL